MRDERRFLSKSEKRQVYLLADGRCQRCGSVLTDRWDAHHIKRWSDGGLTTTKNIVALCVNCHKKIHSENNNMIKPRGWQKNAFGKFKTNIEKDFFLIEATPGAGKTAFSGLCAKHLLDKYFVDYTIIVVPTTALKSAFTEAFHDLLGIELSPVVKGGTGFPAKNYQGGVVTYQQLPNLITTFETWKKNGAKLFFVFDEIHHASDENIWGSAVESCGRAAVKMLGMTGTPFRGDCHPISFVKYNDDGKCIPDFSFSYKEAVAANVCRELLFVHDDGIAEYMFNEKIEEQRVSKSPKSKSGKVAATIFKKEAQWLNRVITKADEKLNEYRVTTNAGGLVICRPGYSSNKDRHLHDVACAIHKITGEEPTVITHDDPDANTKIEKFRDGRSKWIVSVRKISEGIDIKRLKVCVLASYPSTELLFRQIIGRVVRVEDSNKIEDATVFMAKFGDLVEMANRITEEAQAGIKEREKLKGAGDGDVSVQQDSLFQPMSSTHEDGGGVSSFGEKFSSDEILYAEQIKSTHPMLRSMSITNIARLHKVHNILPPNHKSPTKPRHEIIMGLRKELNSLVRKFAIIKNPNQPDFQFVWAILNKRLGVKNINDLCDNREVEEIESAIDIVKSQMTKVSEVC